MLMQNFGMTNKEYYGMLWHFRSVQFTPRNMNTRVLTILTQSTALEQKRLDRRLLSPTLPTFGYY